jgi:hypothetical protein
MNEKGLYSDRLFAGMLKYTGFPAGLIITAESSGMLPEFSILNNTGWSSEDLEQLIIKIDSINARIIIVRII